MTDNLLKPISLLLLDVDGVLTTGQVIYNDAGQETKVFNVRDGLGIRLLMEAGITVGIVTGRRSEALVHRCKNLGIELLKDGIRDKAAALHKRPLPGREKSTVAFRPVATEQSTRDFSRGRQCETIKRQEW